MFCFRKFALNTTRTPGRYRYLDTRFVSIATKHIEKKSSSSVERHDVLNVDQGLRIVEDVVDYSIHGPSSSGVQGGHDDLLDVIETENVGDRKKLQVSSESNEQVESYNCNNNVNLYSCMQTNVPEPFNAELNHSDHYNMPGGGSKLFDKYIQDVQGSNHQNRTYHTSARLLSMPVEKIQYEEYELAPQGVQGDDCVNLKLWMENCQRYGLPNCDEKLNSVISGRKTLAQVFKEQEDIIQQVAQSYKQKRMTENKKNDTIQGIQDMDYSSSLNTDNSSVQGVQGMYSKRAYHLTSPQGIQGDECVQFRLWLENCNRFGLDVECEEQLIGLESGRKTLAQVFAEQDTLIRNIVHQYQQRRQYSTSSDKGKEEVGTSSDKSTPPPNAEDQDKSASHPKSEDQIPDIDSIDTSKLSQRQRLQLSVKHYGSGVMVFHITISLASLGLFYLAVSR